MGVFCDHRTIFHRDYRRMSAPFSERLAEPHLVRNLLRQDNSSVSGQPVEDLTRKGNRHRPVSLEGSSIDGSHDFGHGGEGTLHPR